MKVISVISMHRYSIDAAFSLVSIYMHYSRIKLSIFWACICLLELSILTLRIDEGLQLQESQFWDE